MKNTDLINIVSLLYLFISNISTSDITKNVFGKLTDGMPAAFGDFNSDELTDLFVLRDEGKSIEILLAYEEEPLIRRASTPLKCTFKNHITSVVPGDFDGDALMDVLVTSVKKRTGNDLESRSHTYVHILWGGATYLNCTNEDNPVIKMIGQPLAIDYNQDMIIDLFGTNVEDRRVFWIFNETREKPQEIHMNVTNLIGNYKLRRPHSHSYLGKFVLIWLFIVVHNTFHFYQYSLVMLLFNMMNLNLLL